jgi:3-methyladenine DNA glycosylase AlkD
MTPSAEDMINRLQALADPEAKAGMARYGIQGGEVLGIKIPVLRKLAREIGVDHDLAVALWDSGVHEARILAAFIGDPDEVTVAQMETWVAAFDSWDVCDQVCGNLFDRTPFAYEKAVEWSEREAAFVKRAGFALMAYLAIHDKKAGDERFTSFFPLIVRQATDDRHYVKKAVNWALRQIGKRNQALNALAIQTARQIAEIDSSAARWIASDALRELTGEKVRSRLGL